MSAFLIAGILAGCAPSDPLQEARESLEAGRFSESIEILEELISENKTLGLWLHYPHVYSGINFSEEGSAI